MYGSKDLVKAAWKHLRFEYFLLYSLGICIMNGKQTMMWNMGELLLAIQAIIVDIIASL
eukprot:gene11196-12484_t